jgi:hypothetical protein
MWIRGSLQYCTVEVCPQSTYIYRAPQCMSQFQRQEKRLALCLLCEFAALNVIATEEKRVEEK